MNILAVYLCISNTREHFSAKTNVFIREYALWPRIRPVQTHSYLEFVKQAIKIHGDLVTRGHMNVNGRVLYNTAC